MSNANRATWSRHIIEAELLSDAHFGTGSGGGGIDALAARDRCGLPVIWASHVEGVLRDAARRLRGIGVAGDLFGRAGGGRQRAVFTSLYSEQKPETHVWRSTAREAFNNRAPKDDTLRVVEYVPRGTKFSGQVELPESEVPMLQRLLQEVDALGSGRAAGAGRVRLSLVENAVQPLVIGTATGRLRLLLRNIEPLCITATATPDNLIPSLSFIPGRTVLGAIAHWLLAEGHCEAATLLVGGRVAVSDALPVPDIPLQLSFVEVLPAPLSLQSEKPGGAKGPIPWWARARSTTQRLDGLSAETEETKKRGPKLKRPEDDLFVYRAGPDESWQTFCPALRVRLRNGRPDPKQADASLFAIEHIVERTWFLCELRGSREDMEMLANRLLPVLEGRRWLRMGRAGAPVEIANLEWCFDTSSVPAHSTALLTLTSDLLLRDELLRWCTSIDENRLKQLPGWPANVTVESRVQDTVMVRGFNGTSRLWRMPAAAVRRGSVFRVDGEGVAQLSRMASNGNWLGERTHEGFGRFRLDDSLPGITSDVASPGLSQPAADAAEDAVAATTREWFRRHRALAKPDGSSNPKTPSLSQWFDLMADLEPGDLKALDSRLSTTTAGAQCWKHNDAKAVLEKLNALPTLDAQTLHAQFFVRWLRPVLKAELSKGAT